MSFYKQLAKDIGHDTVLMDDATGSAEFTGWIDTGSYVINAQVSGTIFGGIPNNKITGLAGAEATGKTYFLLNMIRSFQKNHPDAAVAFYDTESATTKEMMESRGIRVGQILLNEPEYVQQFTTRSVNALNAYHGIPQPKPPLMMALDSLGNLPSLKELEDTTSGEEKRDMTRSQAIRSAFRVLTIRAARAKVPLVVTNHTYSTMDKYNPVAIAGGGGMRYAASTIMLLSKLKDKELERSEGTIIKSVLAKSRFTREKTEVRTRLTFRDGLDRYYGLLALGIEVGVLRKEGTKVAVMGQSDTWYGKHIRENPEKFWTPETLKLMDEGAREYFEYGSENTKEEEEDEC